MNEKIRDITLVLTIALFSFPLFAHSADCDNGLKVTGNARESVRPDIAYITVYAQANGLLMEDAVKKATSLVNEITKAAKEESEIIKKIIVKDLAVGQTQSEPWRSNQTGETPKPQVTKQIRIHCEPKPTEIYKIIDKAIRTGALMKEPSRTTFSDDVSSVVAYGVIEYSEVVQRLKKQAIDDARTKAEELANLAGKKVGDIVGIGCSNSRSFRESMRFIGQLPNFPTEYIGLDSEEIIISHDISVTFKLDN